MTISPRLWLATFVALVFAIGISAGVLIDRAWLLRPHMGDHFGPGGPGGGPGGRGGPGGQQGGLIGPPSDRIVADLDGQLHLTDDQRQRILTILEAHRPRVREMQDDARKKFTDEQQSLQDEIAKTLTPEQASKFREFAARQPPPPGSGRRGGRGRG